MSLGKYVFGEGSGQSGSCVSSDVVTTVSPPSLTFPDPTKLPHETSSAASLGIGPVGVDSALPVSKLGKVFSSVPAAEVDFELPTSPSQITHHHVEARSMVHAPTSKPTELTNQESTSQQSGVITESSPVEADTSSPIKSSSDVKLSKLACTDDMRNVEVKVVREGECDLEWPSEPFFIMKRRGFLIHWFKCCGDASEEMKFQVLHESDLHTPLHTFRGARVYLGCGGKEDEGVSGVDFTFDGKQLRVLYATGKEDLVTLRDPRTRV